MKLPIPTQEAVTESYRADWEAIGNDMRLAFGEVAMQMGGEDLAYRVNRIASRGVDFPDASAIIPLQRIDPKAHKAVLDRFREINAERREAELAASLPQARRNGFLHGIGSVLNLFGNNQ